MTPNAALRATLSALILVACAHQAAAVITSNVCNLRWEVKWSLKRFGPIFMCSGRNASVTFAWPAIEQHGIFMIPSDKCPSNFTAWATDDYKELAPVSAGGSYVYQVPDQPGMYWLTSQSGTDCVDGMSAQIQVMEAGVRATSSGRAARPGLLTLLSAALAALAGAVLL